MHYLSGCPQSHHAPGSRDEEQNLVQKSNWRREEGMEMQYPPSHSKAGIFQLLISHLESAFSWVSPAPIPILNITKEERQTLHRIWPSTGRCYASISHWLHQYSFTQRGTKSSCAALPLQVQASSVIFFLILGLPWARPAQHSRPHTTQSSLAYGCTGWEAHEIRLTRNPPTILVEKEKAVNQPTPVCLSGLPCHFPLDISIILLCLQLRI